MGRVAWAFLAASVALAMPGEALPREGALPLPEVPWASGWRSRAAVEWEAHRDLPWRPGPPAAFTLDLASPRPPVEVLGFLPYWTVGQAVVPLDRLTSLAYFAVEVRADGSLGDERDWGTATLAPVAAAARDAGVRLLLTATCFDETAMTSLLGSATLRKKAADALADLVARGGGDGVNVDFEGLPLSRKAQFTAFVGELKAALEDALGRSHVTVDTPAVDWAGAYDYDALALAGDGLVVMGYDYHYRGGDPGPVAPLAGSTLWGKYSLDWTLKDYEQFAGKANLGRVLLALPLYGYDWPATSDGAGADGRGSGTARFYADCARRAADAGGWRWDDDSTTPWFAWNSGGWRQTWCEDLRSLSAKVALAAARDLGGVAFWALGYEESSGDPWAAVDAAWPAVVPEPPAEPLPDASASPDGGPDDARSWDWIGQDGTSRPEGWTPGIEIPLPPDGAAEAAAEAPSEAREDDLAAGDVAGRPDAASRRDTGCGARAPGPGPQAPAVLVLLAALAWLRARARRREGPSPGPAE